MNASRPTKKIKKEVAAPARASRRLRKEDPVARASLARSPPPEARKSLTIILRLPSALLATLEEKKAAASPAPAHATTIKVAEKEKKEKQIPGLELLDA